MPCSAAMQVTLVLGRMPTKKRYYVAERGCCSPSTFIHAAGSVTLDDNFQTASRHLSETIEIKVPYRVVVPLLGKAGRV